LILSSQTRPLPLDPGRTQQPADFSQAREEHFWAPGNKDGIIYLNGEARARARARGRVIGRVGSRMTAHHHLYYHVLKPIRHGLTPTSIQTHHLDHSRFPQYLHHSSCMLPPPYLDPSFTSLPSLHFTFDIGRSILKASFFPPCTVGIN
jgi:hypothetical protein